MKKYEEEHYKYETMKEDIYPWVKTSLDTNQALNGKNLSEREVPVIPFVGDLKIIFVIRRGEETFEVLRDNMLPPDCDIAELYQTACENLVRDVEFVIGNTMYGAFAILADGYHEVSSLCFKHIWQMCVDKLKDDLIIMAPSADTVLFAPAGQTEVVEMMLRHGEQAYDSQGEKVSKILMKFSKDRKELSVYEKAD